MTALFVSTVLLVLASRDVIVGMPTTSWQPGGFFAISQGGNTGGSSPQPAGQLAHTQSEKATSQTGKKNKTKDAQPGMMPQSDAAQLAMMQQAAARYEAMMQQARANFNAMNSKIQAHLQGSMGGSPSQQAGQFNTHTTFSTMSPSSSSPDVTFTAQPTVNTGSSSPSTSASQGSNPAPTSPVQGTSPTVNSLSGGYFPFGFPVPMPTSQPPNQQEYTPDQSGQSSQTNQPSEPTQPVPPTQPTQPTQPAQPTQPPQSVQPTQPAQPVQPVQPVQPSQPVPSAPVAGPAAATNPQEAALRAQQMMSQVEAQMLGQRSQQQGPFADRQMPLPNNRPTSHQWPQHQMTAFGRQDMPIQAHQSSSTWPQGQQSQSAGNQGFSEPTNMQNQQLYAMGHMNGRMQAPTPALADAARMSNMHGMNGQADASMFNMNNQQQQPQMSLEQQYLQFLQQQPAPQLPQSSPFGQQGQSASGSHFAQQPTSAFSSQPLSTHSHFLNQHQSPPTSPFMSGMARQQSGAGLGGPTSNPTQAQLLQQFAALDNKLSSMQNPTPAQLQSVMSQFQQLERQMEMANNPASASSSLTPDMSAMAGIAGMAGMPDMSGMPAIPGVPGMPLDPSASMGPDSIPAIETQVMALESRLMTHFKNPNPDPTLTAQLVAEYDVLQKNLKAAKRAAAVSSSPVPSGSNSPSQLSVGNTAMNSRKALSSMNNPFDLAGIGSSASGNTSPLSSLISSAQGLTAADINALQSPGGLQGAAALPGLPGTASLGPRARDILEPMIERQEDMMRNANNARKLAATMSLIQQMTGPSSGPAMGPMDPMNGGNSVFPGTGPSSQTAPSSAASGSSSMPSLPGAFFPGAASQSLLHSPMPDMFPPSPAADAQMQQFLQSFQSSAGMSPFFGGAR
ncbi:uncharacterized protein [Haliotis asinina]|uniref:uncharacterized protein isoform X3 n=1 Tax=Haliotis asinina TaxID=109174 RepID=UPI00353221D3